VSGALVRGGLARAGHPGKNSKAVIFKVGRKLLSRILAVIKTETPYSIGVIQ